MNRSLTLKINRLILAIIITFIVADTYPHPNLAPGLVETLSRQAIARFAQSG